MDLGTILIVITCVLAFALPFIITVNNRRKKEKTLLKSILNSVREHGGELTNHEICGNYAIGIDEVNSKLFFQSHLEKETKLFCIDLTEIDSCMLSRINETFEGDEIIRSLELKLVSKNDSHPEKALVFYNTDVNFQLNGELKSIERWNGIINQKLSTLGFSPLILEKTGM